MWCKNKYIHFRKYQMGTDVIFFKSTDENFEPMEAFFN